MIRVQIGDEERDLASADEQWINQQINRRRADGETVCVRVTINQGGLNMVLATPTCGPGSGGGRRPNHDEQRVFDLWDKRGLAKGEFTGGNVVAFLKQLETSL
jgi:hypothetical protein